MTVSRLWPVLAAAIALPALPQQARSQSSGVSVDRVWARATAGQGKTGAVYATITASQPDRLTAASTPAAEMAELHQSQMHNGVMEMRAVDGLAVTPGAPVTLAPGGYHIMLMGLKHPLTRGEHVPLTLTFEHAGTVTVEASVEGSAATQPAMGAMPGMTHK